MLNVRTLVATQEHVEEAFRLFNVSTLDAARSGINEHLNLTPEIANEIRVDPNFYSPLMSKRTFWSKLNALYTYFFDQQAETHIKRRMGIGSHISERRLIDDLTRMGMNESIVRNSSPHMLIYLLLLFGSDANHEKSVAINMHDPDKESSTDYAPEG